MGRGTTFLSSREDAREKNVYQQLVDSQSQSTSQCVSEERKIKKRERSKHPGTKWGENKDGPILSDKPRVKVKLWIH